MTPRRALTLAVVPLRWAWWLLRVVAVAEWHGTRRLADRFHRWRTLADDSAELRDTSGSLGPGDWKARDKKKKRVKAERSRRTSWSWGAGILLADGIAAAAWWTGHLVLVPAAAVGALLLACGLAGIGQTPRNETHATPDAPEIGRITRPMVLAALDSLGLPKIGDALKANPDGKGWFPRGITRDGPGHRVEVELPAGVTVPDVAERRERLASALRQPLGCVWVESADEHAGRMVLWIGDQELSKAQQPEWPLLRAGRFDIFDPVPFGADVRGRPVTLPMIETNLLIGAIPGAGKTLSLRLPLLAAALDPRVELRLFNLKGTNDLAPLERVAVRYASGADDGTLEECLESLREVHADLERRAERIRNLSLRECPESKVTPELATDPSLGLHPLVMAIDEVQDLYSGYKQSNNKVAAEAARLSTQIIKRGRALGVILILATQRPDEESMPTGIRANVGSRFCLRVTDHPANDMILGAGMSKRGVSATVLKPRDRGVGYLVGASDEPMVVRTYPVDLAQAEEVATRAALLRQGKTTPVVESEPGPSDPLILAALDCLNGDGAVSLADLLARLQAEGHCGGWDTQRLGTELGSRGVQRPSR